jgi:hypothetical protein
VRADEAAGRGPCACTPRTRMHGASLPRSLSRSLALALSPSLPRSLALSRTRAHTHTHTHTHTRVQRAASLRLRCIASPKAQRACAPASGAEPPSLPLPASHHATSLAARDPSPPPCLCSALPCSAPLRLCLPCASLALSLSLAFCALPLWPLSAFLRLSPPLSASLRSALFRSCARCRRTCCATTASTCAGATRASSSSTRRTRYAHARAHARCEHARARARALLLLLLHACALAAAAAACTHLRLRLLPPPARGQRLRLVPAAAASSLR